VSCEKTIKYSNPWGGVGHSFGWVTGLGGVVVVTNVCMKFVNNDKSLHVYENYDSECARFI